MRSYWLTRSCQSFFLLYSGFQVANGFFGRTPDCSRFWSARDYVVGQAPKSFDSKETFYIDAVFEALGDLLGRH